MDRDEFMEIVYETFADEPDNVLANGIIEAADAYVEHEKAQLSQEDATSDLIDRKAALKAINSWRGRFSEEYNEAIDDCENSIKELPTIQPEPKEGHWIDKGWDGDWAWQIDGRGNCWRVIECSECGKSVLVESNYCPHCGSYNGGGRK